MSPANGRGRGSNPDLQKSGSPATSPRKTSTRPHRKPTWSYPTTWVEVQDAVRQGYIDRDTADEIRGQRGDELW